MRQILVGKGKDKDLIQISFVLSSIYVSAISEPRVGTDAFVRPPSAILGRSSEKSVRPSLGSAKQVHLNYRIH